MTLSEQVAHAVPADLSTLAWVADELRRTLDNAHKALRRQVRETEAAPGTEIDGAAAPAMQQARALFHQGAGALDMVGQAEGARMLRASEQAVLRFMQKIRLLDNDAATTIERSSFALLDFLRRRLSGKDVSPIALFPQYREVQTLAGADRIHPADLWNADAQSSGTQLANAAPALVKASAATHVMALQPDADTRGRMEQCMLALLRGPVGPAATQMSQLFAGLAAGASGDTSLPDRRRRRKSSRANDERSMVVTVLMSSWRTFCISRSTACSLARSMRAPSTWPTMSSAPAL